MASVEIDKVSKSFQPSRKQSVAAVRDATLSVGDGEFVVLVGPSGCGKSTLLRMIAGLEDPTAGEIRIGGRVVNDVPPKDRDVAMVFQNYALYPHMTVFDNMAFGLKLRKVPKAEIQQRVHEAATVLGLADHFDRYPRELSGGQRQRVALGRAIVRHPQVFLFDEPLSNLDARMRVQMRIEIGKLHRRLRATMIYVTHDQLEAMTMGDRIAVMKDGVIQQIADPLTIYNDPANTFVAGFIGTPPMNLIAGRIETNPAGGFRFIEHAGGKDGFTLSLPEFPFAVEPSRRVVLGLRPEHLGIAQADSAAAIEARTDFLEPLGAETFLHARTPGHVVVARMPSSFQSAPGDPLMLACDGTHALFFDAQSGTRLQKK